MDINICPSSYSTFAPATSPFRDFLTFTTPASKCCQLRCAVPLTTCSSRWNTLGGRRCRMVLVDSGVLVTRIMPGEAQEEEGTVSGVMR